PPPPLLPYTTLFRSVEEVNQALRQASTGALQGILAYNDAPLVSVDFNHDAHSSVFDATLTKVIEGTLVKVCAWYDNEWGFSSRIDRKSTRLNSSHVA